jgi:hypothetical protein
MRARNPRRGGILGALVLSAVIVCAIVAVAGIYVARSIRVETREGRGNSDVSIDTPAGHLSIQAHDNPGAGVSGIPLYPGARARKDSGGNAVIQWSGGRNGDKDNGGFAVAASDMITDDPADKVAEYYRRELPNWMVTTDKHGKVAIQLDKGGYKRIVSIEEKSDGTHIGVASIGEPASN